MRSLVAALGWIALALAPAACDQPTPNSPGEVFSWPSYPDEVAPNELVEPKNNQVPPNERVPPYLPAAPRLPRAASAPITPSPAAPPGGFAPGLPPGPVTNYGTGGMQQMPGAPPNPPYPLGGLMH